MIFLTHFFLGGCRTYGIAADTVFCFIQRFFTAFRPGRTEPESLLQWLALVELAKKSDVAIIQLTFYPAIKYPSVGLPPALRGHLP